MTALGQLASRFLVLFQGPAEEKSVPGRAHNRLSALLALALPVLGMYAGQFVISVIPYEPGWGIAIIGLCLLLLAVRIRGLAAARLANGLEFLLAFAIGLPLAMNPGGFKSVTPAWQQIAQWLFSICVVVTATLRVKPIPIRLGLEWPRLNRWDWLILVLLVAGSLALRVPALETVPSGYDPDEAALGHFLWDAASGLAGDPFTTGWATHPTLQFFINSVFVRVFGRTFFAIRLPWAVMGSLAVAALYFLARAGYGRRVAILAGMLLLGSDVAIHFSRLGLNNIGDALFMSWTLAAFWIAGATGRPLAFALAGVGMGLAQYYYFGNRAIPFVVAGNLLVWIIADWRGVLRARNLIVAFLLVTLVVAEPLLGNWLRTPSGFTDHMELTVFFSDRLARDGSAQGASTWVLIAQRAVDSLLIFNVTPDHGGSYHSGQPMLHPLEAPLFLLGVLVILARWRRPFNGGLVAWIVVHLTLGSVLITDAATFQRLLGLLPAGILLAAVGLDAAASHAARVVHWGPRVQAAALAAVVVFLVAVDVQYYFMSYIRTVPYRDPVQEAVSVAALEYEQARGQGTFLLCSHAGIEPASGHIYYEPISFIAGDAFLGAVPAVLARPQTAQPVYLYALPDMLAECEQIATRWPGGTWKEYQRTTDKLFLMRRYTVAVTDEY